MTLHMTITLMYVPVCIIPTFLRKHASLDEGALFKCKACSKNGIVLAAVNRARVQGSNVTSAAA